MKKVTIWLAFLVGLGLVSILLCPQVFAYKYRLPEEFMDKKVTQLSSAVLGGRTELTDLEKEEIKKYGYTALEVTQYNHSQFEPGMNCLECSKDNQGFARVLLINRRGHIRWRHWLWRIKFYYPENGAQGYQDEIAPPPGYPIGSITWKGLVIITNPPYVKGTTQLIVLFSDTAEKQKDADQWLWLPNLRRVRKLTAAEKEDGLLGADLTMDDWGDRKSHEETHRIMRVDKIGGEDVFIIESKSIIPDYYAPRRVIWITKKTFLDSHQEQFDRTGKLFKVYNRYYHKIEPWGDWGRWMVDAVDLSSGHRSVLHYVDRELDAKYPDSFFTFRQLEKEEIWAAPQMPLPIVKSTAELPEPPVVDWNFWKSIGETPEVVK